MEGLQDLALTLPCGFCGAQPDEWCVTMPAKHLAQYLHESRLYAVRQAYGQGYMEGYDDARLLAEEAAKR